MITLITLSFKFQFKLIKLICFVGCKLYLYFVCVCRHMWCIFFNLCGSTYGMTFPHLSTRLLYISIAFPASQSCGKIPNIRILLHFSYFHHLNASGSGQLFMYAITLLSMHIIWYKFIITSNVQRRPQNYFPMEM